MTAAFTPGPWYLNGGFVYSERSRDELRAAKAKDRNSGECNIPIAKVIADRAGEQQANASLIVTAPKLYEMGENAALTLTEMAAILRGVGRPGCADICEAEVTRINLRLAKARGETL